MICGSCLISSNMTKKYIFDNMREEYEYLEEYNNSHYEKRFSLKTIMFPTSSQNESFKYEMNNYETL
jgi:hypothetical protein